MMTRSPALRSPLVISVTRLSVMPTPTWHRLQLATGQHRWTGAAAVVAFPPATWRGGATTSAAGCNPSRMRRRAVTSAGGRMRRGIRHRRTSLWCATAILTVAVIPGSSAWSGFLHLDDDVVGDDVLRCRRVQAHRLTLP